MTTYLRTRMLRQRKPKSLRTSLAVGTLRRLSQPPLFTALEGGSAGQPCEGGSPNPLLKLNTQPGHLSFTAEAAPHSHTTFSLLPPAARSSPGTMSPAHTTVRRAVRQIQLGNCSAGGPTAVCTDREDKAGVKKSSLPWHCRQKKLLQNTA